MTQAEAIQGILRERVTDLDNHILTKEGVYAEINLEEGGLNKAEGSFGGVHPNTWDEYRRTFAQQVTVEHPADFENMPPEMAATYIVNFKDWYFQKPPKQNFFALPPLLWLVACDNAYLAPAPVIARIQKLTGDPNPDGIWGSGTTERVETFFANKTVPDIVQFAKELTELMVVRYAELGEHEAYAQDAPHWIERCERKLQMLYDYVNRKNQTADVEVETEQELSENTPPVETENQAETSPVPDAPHEDYLGLAAIIDNQANVIAEQTKAIEKFSGYHQNLAEAITRHNDIVREMRDNMLVALGAQAETIDKLKEALLSYTTLQEDLLKKLSEQTETRLPSQPASARGSLNALPDSLVQ